LSTLDGVDVEVEVGVVSAGEEAGAGERSYVDGPGPPAVGLRGATTSWVPLGPRESSVLLETRMAKPPGERVELSIT
jgi:hypothetical protein